MSKLITVLIPIYNEEKNLPELLFTLKKLSRGELHVERAPEKADDVSPDLQDYQWEFLFINDGSTDNSLEVLLREREEDKRIKVIDLSRNFGKENALLAGLDYAKGDAVIIMDADLQHPPELIPEMVHYWETGDEDVYCKRANRDTDPLPRRILSNIFYRLLGSSSEIEMTPNAGDFRLLDRKVVDNLKNLREVNRYTKGLYSWVGFRKKEIPFEVRERTHGKSSFNLFKLTNLAVEGITSFSVTPLRLATIVGFIVSLLALFYIIFIIIKTLAFGETVQGFPTLMCAILFLGGLQLIALGIIGEYIGKIYNETKNRGVYIVRSINGEI